MTVLWDDPVATWDDPRYTWDGIDLSTLAPGRIAAWVEVQGHVHAWSELVGAM